MAPELSPRAQTLHARCTSLHPTFVAPAGRLQGDRLRGERRGALAGSREAAQPGAEAGHVRAARAGRAEDFHA
eukprot:6893809-Pyramimonas_sp.AAC.1